MAICCWTVEFLGDFRCLKKEVPARTKKKGAGSLGWTPYQCIGSGRFGSIELDGRGKPDGGRAVELVENSNEEVSFGEENW